MPLLTLNHLHVEFSLKTGQRLHALTDVNLVLHAGEVLGVVGESGCGKSTLARAILQLVPLKQGSIDWQGLPLNAHALTSFRRDVQCVFQDPLDALDPRMTVGDSIQEPLRALCPELNAQQRQSRVDELLRAVGLQPDMYHRYPHEFSGGQCQRIGIARALAIQPQLIICDEAVSALDVSIRGQIIQLLQTLQQQHGLALLFISHDLGVVKQLCQRVVVLYLGRVMEVAPTASLYEKPLHPYTHLLLSAIPLADPLAERQRLAALTPSTQELPSPLNPPTGCVFHTRCPKAQAICREVVPVLQSIDNRQVACHLI